MAASECDFGLAGIAALRKLIVIIPDTDAHWSKMMLYCMHMLEYETERGS